MNSAPSALRSTRTSGLEPVPLYRPTLALAAIYISVWLLGRVVTELGVVFGGTPSEGVAGNVGRLLTDQTALADYFFDKVAYSIIVIVTIISVLRWWRIIQFEPTALRPRIFAVVPWAAAAAFAAATIIGIAVTPEPSASLIVIQLIAMAGFVFVEEIAWRGVALVGLRGSGFPEWAVWLITSAGFSLMHLLNLIKGAGLESTLFQLVFTFILGTACYLGRRAGGLWLAFAVHFTSNFLQAAAQGSGDSPLFGLVNNVAMVGQLLLLLSVPATIIFLILEARRARREAQTAAPSAE